MVNILIKVSHFLGCIAFLMPVLLPLIMLAKSCHRCNEMVYVEFNVCTIDREIDRGYYFQNKKNIGRLHDLFCDEYSEPLHLLALQMQHEPLDISAKGFCRIDYSLIGFVFWRFFLRDFLISFLSYYRSYKRQFCIC